ncbi:MAG: DUF5320 family protein [Armatimonadetes bacterium]|nr:DUF5320 family protein [Armatimonadota bacterium]
MRHRNMYYLTGLPGWMRFGFSPGWVGRSPTGLGPCASYLLTGQWPTPAMAAAWPAVQAGQWPLPGYGMGWAGAAGAPGAAWGAQQDPGALRQALQAQMAMLEQQLEALRQQLAELEQAEGE